MKVGPISIEKEFDYQQWRVSLTIQHMSYYTRWYSSHLYTKQDAIEKFIEQSEAEIPRAVPWDISEIFDEAKTALLFLEVDEMDQ